MTTRRNCLAGLSVFAATAVAADANLAYDVLKVGPRPKLVYGHNGEPDKVDFGHGLLVPMNKDAFHALWEGDDRWIAYGHGFGHNAAKAMGQAEEAAIGTMKLYLLTLAFAPNRLMRVAGGGWILKSGAIADLVQGEIALPGRPVMPTTDVLAGSVLASSRGSTGGTTGSFTTDPDIAGLTSSGTGGGVDYSSPNREETTHATTGWLVWKRDVNLDDVRRRAVLLVR